MLRCIGYKGLRIKVKYHVEEMNQILTKVGFDLYKNKFCISIFIPKNNIFKYKMK